LNHLWITLFLLLAIERIRNSMKQAQTARRTSRLPRSSVGRINHNCPKQIADTAVRYRARRFNLSLRSLDECCEDVRPTTP
jgi:hypothetical protein